MLTYRDFAQAGDLPAYDRVSRLTQQLASVARKLLVEWSPASTYVSQGKHKQFVIDGGRRWRARCSENSDNSTEKSAHFSMGVYDEVNMLDTDSLVEYFMAVWGHSRQNCTVRANNYHDALRKRMAGK